MSVSTLAPTAMEPVGTTTALPQPLTDPDASATVDDAGRGGAVPDAPDGDYDRIVWVPPSSLVIGPNARQENAEPDPEQVRAFKKAGVQDPIKAYGDENGRLVVVVGQLRTLGAIKAGVERVPVWVQPAPSGTDKAQTVERLVTQFSENRHRKAMTRGDEFRVFEQLALEGMSPTAIGRALSVGKPEVVASLAVGRSELAATAADKYDLTLDQAAVVAEFEGYGDLDTAKELILTAVDKPTNFATLAQRKRNDRAEAQRRRELEAALTEQLSAAGVRILDESVPDWTGPARPLDWLRPRAEDMPGTVLTVEDHADCPGHSAWIDVEYDDNDREVPVAVYGCADFAAHGHALRHAWSGPVGTPASAASGEDDLDGAAALAAAEAEVQRRTASIQRRWVINNNKDADAALPGRREWLAAFSRRAGLPKGARRWLALRTFDSSPVMHKAMERRHPLAHELLGLPVPMRSWSSSNGTENGGDGEDFGELHRRIVTASDAKAAVYELYLILCAMEEAFTRDSWRNPTSLDKVYIAMAIELGYPAPDVDRKVLHPDDLDAIIAAELGHDRPDTTGIDDKPDGNLVSSDLAA